MKSDLDMKPNVDQSECVWGTLLLPKPAGYIPGAFVAMRSKHILMKNQ